MRTFMKLLLMDLGIKKVYLMQNGMDAVEAQVEFDASLSSRELIDQDSIAKIFRKGKDDERN